MLYKVTHSTKYNYNEPVSVCHNLVHLSPRDTTHQKCEFNRLAVQPIPADRDRRVDYYGNHVELFSIQQPHRRLTVTATSRVRVEPKPPPAIEASTAWEVIRGQMNADRSNPIFDAYQFCFASDRVPVDRRRWNTPAEGANANSDQFTTAVQQYALKSFTANRPILDAARDLTRRIHAEYAFDAKATTLNTPVEKVFVQRRGVCQDFAHLQIACLRSLGLAARYVSGYLRTDPPPGQQRLVGADVSHAWVSLYAGSAGWVDFDPTNDVIPNQDHITVAWGRDYNDICPIQGVFVGGGRHSIGVSVDVAPIDSNR